MHVDTIYRNHDWNMQAIVAYSSKAAAYSVKVLAIKPSASFIDRDAQLFSRKAEAHRHARTVVGMSEAD